MIYGLFQSTLPHGERPIDLTNTKLDTVVSIHAPARGATIISPSFRLLNQCFNPRSRTGSDPEYEIPEPHRHVVSIHAPARGATSDLELMEGTYIVSIHAPARGATS